VPRRSHSLPAALAGLVLLVLPAQAVAVRYASPTGTAGASCQTPATACSLTVAVHGKSGDEPAPGEEVIVEPGTYHVTETISAGAAKMDIHGEAGQPRPEITGAVSELIRLEQAESTLSYLYVLDTGSGDEAVFADAAKLERMLIVGKPSGDLLCQCYDGAISDSVFVAEPGSTTAAVGVNSNGGTSDETLRNDTIYSESKEAPAIGLYQEASSGALKIEAFNTIAVNAAGGHDIEATEHATVELSHSDYASPTGAGTVTDVGGRVTSAPLFLDAEAEDFSELPGSPTIDAGLVEEANGAVDYEGLSRTKGASTDIGALEYQDQPPKVTVQASPSQAAVGQAVSFSGSATAPEPGDTIVGYQWSFDDRAAVPAGAGATHAFATPGMHVATLTVTDAAGVRATATATIDVTPTAVCACGVLRLGLQKLALSPRSFHSAGHGGSRHQGKGTDVSFRIGAKADVTFTVRRLEPGLRHKGSCVASRRGLHRQRCTRAVVLGGSFKVPGTPGANVFRFSGRLDGRALKPGRYELSASSLGTVLTADFTIL
jgi:PKD repeat protein